MDAVLYFNHLPDAFRRPNTHLYEWLTRRCAELGVRGILFHHQLWCDTWHAEAQRMKEWLPIPRLSFQTGGESALGAHALSRIQAFMENLR
jgi:benzoyl-CoA reductase/2-hydroxyglutaryl-CoA dehydratase subunit BcrC/BadD/HgdB